MLMVSNNRNFSFYLQHVSSNTQPSDISGIRYACLIQMLTVQCNPRRYIYKIVSIAFFLRVPTPFGDKPLEECFCMYRFAAND